MPSPRHLAPSSRSQVVRRRLGVLVAGALVLALVLLAFRALAGSDGGEEAPAAVSSTSAGGPAPSTDTSSTATSSSSSSSSSASPRPTLPDYTTTGLFMPFSEPGEVRGTSGELITYEVAVEEGSGVSSGTFARAVDAVLRHDRGWTAGGDHRFQRVTDGGADLTIRLATPATVDETCAGGGLDTQGEVSCTLGDEVVMLNLDRWYVGVPHIDDLTLYRQYLINHEVGHAIGELHQACPGRGETAPVMLQQTLDLEGCEPNAWPRSTDGSPITGPPSAG